MGDVEKSLSLPPSPNDSLDYVYSVESTDQDETDYMESKAIVIGTNTNIVQEAGFGPSEGRGNRVPNWTRDDTFALLKAWGEAKLKNNRKNVSSEDWNEIAAKVSEKCKYRRTVTHCHNRLDTLQRRYKKEKGMQAEDEGYASNWVFFSKMDTIISQKQVCSGVGNMQMILDVPPVISKKSAEENEEPSEHRAELAEIRMSILQDLELEWGQMMKNTRAEIAKIWGVSLDDNDISG